MLGVGLDKIADLFATFENPGISTNPRQCTRVRHRKSRCTLCADNCPTHAIQWDSGLKVNADLCTGCGICAAVCPSGALEAANPTNRGLFGLVQAQVKTQPVVAFACPRFLEHVKDRSHFVEVKCIGRVDESTLVGAVSEGAREVQLMEGACAECPHRLGRDVAARTVQTVNELLKAFDVPQRITLTAQWVEASTPPTHEPAPPNAVSRRTFFNTLARETMKTTAVTIGQVLGESTKAKGEVPKRGEMLTRVPVKREMLLNALRHMSKPTMDEIESDLWAQFGFKENCSGCQMCAFFCPTGALIKVEQEGKAGVGFQVSICTNCRLCEDICYLDGVALSRTIKLDPILNNSSQVLLMRDESLVHESPDEKIKRLLGLKTG